MFENLEMPAEPKAADWMADIPDEVLLNQLMIPGTHQSASEFIQMAFLTRCQALSIRQQLDAGYRYLDISLKVEENGLRLTNGAAGCRTGVLPWSKPLYLNQLLDDCKTFLNKHPGECVMLAVQKGEDAAVTAEFQTALNTVLEEYEEVLLTDTMPSIGESRGKIVLLRRFADEAGLGSTAGIALIWNEQSGSAAVHPAYESDMCEGYLLQVQDRYEYGTEKKWTAFLESMEGGDINLNYLSTKGEWAAGHPYYYARRLNSRLKEADLSGEPEGCWIVLDFGDAEVSSRIWSVNLEPQRLKEILKDGPEEPAVEAESKTEQTAGAGDSKVEEESASEETAAPGKEHEDSEPVEKPDIKMLSAYLEKGPDLVIDGTKLVTRLCGDKVVLVNIETLNLVWPWIERLSGTTKADFSMEDGTPFSLVFTEITDPEQIKTDYPGSGGILFRSERDEYWISVEELANAISAPCRIDWDRWALYLGTPAGHVKEGVKVPILCYHMVSNDLNMGDAALFVKPEDFREQLTALLNQGYDPIFFSDLGRIALYDKPIMITIDDGYANTYDVIYPILQELQVKATVFVISGSLGKTNYLTEAQVKELDASDLVQIQSHTVTHPLLSDITVEQQEAEFAESQLEIARITGNLPTVLAYPGGKYSQATIEAAEKYYNYAVTTIEGVYTTRNGTFYEIPRVFVPRSEKSTYIFKKIA